MLLPAIDRLDSLPDALLTELRARFAERGFTEQIMAAAEGIAPGMFDAARLPLLHWWLARRGDDGARLALLFAYAGTVPESEARAALSEHLYEALLQAGVVILAGEGQVRCPFRLLPADDLWILSDEPGAGKSAVMGPGPTTMELVRLLPREIHGAVLDLGCGAGTLALAAARRGAARVLGTDLNERALPIARFNARLNGLHAEFRVGDLYTPAGTEHFDLVVSQPPYVIQPPDTPGVTFLHGGIEGDEIALRVVAGAPAVLAPGGKALILFDTAVRPREPLHARLRARLGAAPVDLLVLAAPGPSPDQQSIGYASLETGGVGAEYDAALLRYRRHLDARGIVENSHALVVLRASSAPGGGFTVTLPVRGFSRGDATTIDAILAGIDLASSDEATLTAACVRATRRARFVEERPRPDPSIEPKITVRFTGGSLSPDREISEAAHALLGALEASESVARAIERYAEACGTSPGEVRRQVLDFVRENLARGLLERDH